MVRFLVDSVESATERLPTRPLCERVHAAGDVEVLLGPERATIDTGGVHPLLAAVHQAFADHRPLVLTPEAVALTLTQGVALHVRLHAEAVRERLVRHLGRKALEVRVGARPSGVASWTACLMQLREELVVEVGPGWGRFFGCGFSTSTVGDEVAAAVVMLDAFSSYYDYLVVGVCGIPEVTLLGTPDDWRQLGERVEILPELGLGLWAASLRPILEQFVAAASGEVDVGFWQEIYKPREVYGADQIAGWIGRLFPYVGREGIYDRPNPMLDVPHHELVLRESPSYSEGIGSIDTSQVPAGPSSATLHLRWAGGLETVTVEGGLFGVEQDAEGRLVPISGFLVRRGASDLQRMRTVVDRIVADHQTEVARDDEPYQGGVATMALLFGTLRSAVLTFGEGSWVLHALAERDVLTVRDPESWLEAFPLITLPAGRVIASCCGRWVVLPARAVAPDARAREALAVRQEQYDEGLITHVELARSRLDLRTSSELGDALVLRGDLADVLGHALDTDGGLDVVEALSELLARAGRPR